MAYGYGKIFGTCIISLSVFVGVVGYAPENSTELRLTTEDVKEKYADVLQNPTNNSATKNAIKLLYQSAISRGLISDEAPITDLIYCFPNEKIGIFLFVNKYAELEEEAHEIAEAFAENVINAVPGSSVAAAALDTQLQFLRKNDVPNFLEKCKDIIVRNTADRVTRVALLRRANYYHDINSVKLAAFDYLRFWFLFPDEVSKMQLKSNFGGGLNQAGFILESDILSDSPCPSKIAQIILKDILVENIRSDMPLREKGELNFYSELYSNLTPDLESLFGSLDLDAKGNGDRLVDKTLFLARLGRLSISQSELDLAVKSYSLFLDYMNNLLKENDPRYDISELLLLASKCVFDSFNSLIEANDSLTSLEGKEQDNGDIRDLTTGLRQVQIRSFRVLAERSSYPDVALYATKYLVGLLLRSDNLIEAEKVFLVYLERFPQSAHTPELMFNLADYYLEQCTNLSSAINTYDDIMQMTVDDEISRKAGYKKTIALFRTGNYNRALKASQEFVDKYPIHPQAQVMKLLLAQCEVKIGKIVESERRYRAIIDDKVSLVVADHALFALACDKFSDQKYGAAALLFKELIERFPQSVYIEQSKTYLERYDTLSRELVSN